MTSAACSTSTITCLATGDDDGGSRLTDTAIWSNGGAGTTVLVAVDSFLSTPSGIFNLDLTVAALPPGDTCSVATAVTLVSGAAALTGQTTSGYSNDYGAGTNCVGTSGADRVYSVVVPMDKRLSAKVTPAASFDAAIAIVAAAACAVTPRVCLAGSNVAFAGQPDTAFWTNGTGGAATVNIIVDGSSSAATGAFALDLVTSDVLPGDVCASATAISFGAGTTASLPAQTTVGFSTDYGSGLNCDGTAGVDRTYTLTVPAGKQVSVTVTPTTASYDPSVSLALRSACDVAPRVCLAASDTAFANQPETVTWTNASTSPVDIVVVVDSFSTVASGGQGTFGLTVALL